MAKCPSLPCRHRTCFARRNAETTGTASHARKSWMVIEHTSPSQINLMNMLFCCTVPKNPHICSCPSNALGTLLVPYCIAAQHCLPVPHFWGHPSVGDEVLLGLSALFRLRLYSCFFLGLAIYRHYFLQLRCLLVYKWEQFRRFFLSPNWLLLLLWIRLFLLQHWRTM